MNWLLERLYGARVARQTSDYLKQQSQASEAEARENVGRLLESFARTAGPKVRLGETSWHVPVDVPLIELIKACGLLTGGMGSGKSMLALIVIAALLVSPDTIGFGVIDAKRELFLGALWLIEQRLDYLDRHDPLAAKALRRRLVIIDFSSRDPLSSYNLNARPPGADPEFFALSRADLLMDLLEGDKLSLGGVGVLQRLLMLLSAFSPPITRVSSVIRDTVLRRQLLSQVKDSSLIHYFAHHFEAVPKSTLAAIERRIEALTASESVRLAMNGTLAPDFRKLQDESRIVLINCFGENIARSVCHLLHGLVISDVRHGVFSRLQPDRLFLWTCDEAQNFFL